MQIRTSDSPSAPLSPLPAKKDAKPEAKAPSRQAVVDQFQGKGGTALTDAEKLAKLKEAVAAAQAADPSIGSISGPPAAPDTPIDPQDPLYKAFKTIDQSNPDAEKDFREFNRLARDLGVALNPGYVEVTGRQQAERPKPGQKPSRHQDPQVIRPPYTGGAPALDASEMDPTMVNNNPELRLLYTIEGKAPWALKGYQVFTKVLGPAGALFNLGYSAFNAKRILSDPKTPGFLKGGIVASTAMAGVSAASAVRVGLHAWHIWPMAAKGAITAGKIAGVAGLGAGAVLSAMDTFNTFRDPKATAAQKGISLIGTAASVAMPILILAGVGGPIGIGVGLLAIGLPFLKNWLGKMPVVNKAFEAVGHALSPVTHGVSAAASGLKHTLGKLF